MRYTLLFLFLISNPLFSQHTKEQVTNTFTFREGIYTTARELLLNIPKYPDCRLDITKPVAGYPTIHFYDAQNVQHVYDDSCFAVVNQGVLFIWHIQSFYKAWKLGTLTLLKQTNWRSAQQKEYVTALEPGLLLDFEEGRMVTLHLKNVSDILLRDPEIAREMAGTTKSENKQRLFYYIAKYNENHPLYVPDRR